MELIINKDFARYSVEIFAKEERGSQIILFGYDDGKIIEQTLDKNEMATELLPLLRIPMGLFNELILQFANLAKENGISTENENLLIGKLEATQKHLEDMREISKKLFDYNIKINNGK